MLAEVVAYFQTAAVSIIRAYVKGKIFKVGLHEDQPFEAKQPFYFSTVFKLWSE